MVVIVGYNKGDGPRICKVERLYYWGLIEYPNARWDGPIRGWERYRRAPGAAISGSTYSE